MFVSKKSLSMRISWFFPNVFDRKELKGKFEGWHQKIVNVNDSERSKLFIRQLQFVATAIARSLPAGYSEKKLAAHDLWNYESISDARDTAGTVLHLMDHSQRNLERPWRARYSLSKFCGIRG